MQQMVSWLVGQAAWAWAKAGIWESDYAEAYAYPNEDEGMHEDYQESEEKPPIDPKDERLFDQKVLINRTRPEACDQEVNFIKYQIYCDIFSNFTATRLHHSSFNFIRYTYTCETHPSTCPIQT